jgi:hypothetical protein
VVGERHVLPEGRRCERRCDADDDDQVSAEEFPKRVFHSFFTFGYEDLPGCRKWNTAVRQFVTGSAVFDTRSAAIQIPAAVPH